MYNHKTSENFCNKPCLPAKMNSFWLVLISIEKIEERLILLVVNALSKLLFKLKI